MRTDVEYEIAGLNEAAIKPIHGRGATSIAIVDIERSSNTAYGHECLEHHLSSNLTGSATLQDPRQAAPRHRVLPERSSPLATGRHRRERTACRAKATLSLWRTGSI